MRHSSFSVSWTNATALGNRSDWQARNLSQDPLLTDNRDDRAQGRNVARVGAGILITRLLGFVRERVFAQFFGIGVEADAFGAAMKIPNVIRNLLGEGTLSASFIPVYAGMVERGETEDAKRLAGAMVSILILVTAACALLGYLLAPVITDLAAPGFSGRQRELTVTLVRILFPMFGFLILSAWCLGILNTHRRFFLSYAAPSVWNIAQIATLLGLGGRFLLGEPLVVALAWGAVVGAILQVAVQLPALVPLVRGMRWGLSLRTPGVRAVIMAWIPVVFGAGIVQISSIIDTQLASLLPNGSVAALRYAQIIAILPVSLFGVGVAAVALPELSRDVAGGGDDALRERLSLGLRQLVYFAVPSAFAFAALGPQLVGSLFQSGSFSSSDTDFVAGILAAYGLAVPAQTSIKLFASGHYALGDTKTPVRIAALAVTVSAGSAIALMQFLGAAGIALGAAIGAYLNVLLNSQMLKRRLGVFLSADDVRSFMSSSIAAIVAAVGAGEVADLLLSHHVLLQAAGGVAAFATLYAVLTLVLKHPEAKSILRAMRGERGR